MKEKIAKILRGADLDLFNLGYANEAAQFSGDWGSPPPPQQQMSDPAYMLGRMTCLFETANSLQTPPALRDSLSNTVFP